MLINIEIIAANIQVILIPKESKASSKFQQKFCHISNQCLFDIPFHHILLEGDKIKNIGIFHRLHGQLALGRWKPPFKVGHFVRQHLPLIQAAFDLVNQNRS